MFSGPNLSHYSPKNAAIWFSLAFQAGAINVGGLLACHRFVTHTTGFATIFGTDLALGDWAGAIGMLMVPLFFLAGTMIAAIFVDHRILQQKNPRYSVVTFLMSIFLILVIMGGQGGLFGNFGEDISRSKDYMLLALLSLTSGIQNATITSAFGAVVRTTHLTGLTTDLGIGLVRIFTKVYRNSPIDERKATWMRLGIIFAFILGATAAFLYLKLHYWGFALPAMISIILFILSLKPQIPARIPS